MYSNRVVVGLTAPTGKFRVLGVNVGADSTALYFIGDFGSLAAAEQAVTQDAKVGGPAFVYNDQAQKSCGTEAGPNSCRGGWTSARND